MLTVISILMLLLNIFVWLVIATVLVSWLVAFGVLNTRNAWVYKGVSLLESVTRPPMDFLRRYIPPIGGIDLTPMVLIFGIFFLQKLLVGLVY